METTIYPLKTSALILVDVLNDFLADDGKLHGLIGPMLAQTRLVENLQVLLAGARAAGLQVFYSPHGQDEHSFDGVKHIHPRFQAGIDNRVFWKGTYGAEFYAPLAPRDGDVVISRHHMFDSFIGTDLEAQLRARGVERVILAGLTSHTCVEGTGRHALEAGYHVTFLKDGVSEFTEAAHRAEIDLSYPTFGHETLTIAEFLARVEHA
jgi:nicotinamidase-related amidase